ncbi:MAG: DUF1409 domain-containing protein [Caulobacteraceae bacterium]|nr:DUF1409 domain-containing protein [Caulobacteraceae bacterium]
MVKCGGIRVRLHLLQLQLPQNLDLLLKPKQYKKKRKTYKRSLKSSALKIGYLIWMRIKKRLKP